MFPHAITRDPEFRKLHHYRSVGDPRDTTSAEEHLARERMYVNRMHTIIDQDRVQLAPLKGSATTAAMTQARKQVANEMMSGSMGSSDSRSLGTHSTHLDTPLQTPISKLTPASSRRGRPQIMFGTPGPGEQLAVKEEPARTSAPPPPPGGGGGEDSSSSDSEGDASRDSDTSSRKAKKAKKAKAKRKEQRRQIRADRAAAKAEASAKAATEAAEMSSELESEYEKEQRWEERPKATKRVYTRAETLEYETRVKQESSYGRYDMRVWNGNPSRDGGPYRYPVAGPRDSDRLLAKYKRMRNSPLPTLNMVLARAQRGGATGRPTTARDRGFTWKFSAVGTEDIETFLGRALRWFQNNNVYMFHLCTDIDEGHLFPDNSEAMRKFNEVREQRNERWRCLWKRDSKPDIDDVQGVRAWLETLILLLLDLFPSQRPATDREARDKINRATLESHNLVGVSKLLADLKGFFNVIDGTPASYLVVLEELKMAIARTGGHGSMVGEGLLSMFMQQLRTAELQWQLMAGPEVPLTDERQMQGLDTLCRDINESLREKHERMQQAVAATPLGSPAGTPAPTPPRASHRAAAQQQTHIHNYAMVMESGGHDWGYDLEGAEAWYDQNYTEE
jgi:hypothetical protein